MKFAEHLLAHITPEWRRQYIAYEDMKTMLYEAIENLPTLETSDSQEIVRLTRAFDEDFLGFCEKELFKINVFYEEKLAEAKRKFDALKKEMDALALEQRHAAQTAILVQRQASVQRPKSQSILSGLGIKLLGSTTTTGGDGLGAQPIISAKSHSGSQSNSIFKSTVNMRERQLKSSNNSPPSYDATPPSAAAQQAFAARVRSHTGSVDLPTVTGVVDRNQSTTTLPSLLIGGGAGNGKATSNITSTNNNSQQLQHLQQVTDKLNEHIERNALALQPGVDKRKLHDLKLAFSEFYLSLVLLQNYQRLNFTGFRKILKKHDKLLNNEDGKRWHHHHVESAFFHTNKDVDKLIEETEAIVTIQLEAGDRQRAMKRLRVPPLNDTPQAWTIFRVGFSSGAFVMLIFAVILTGLFQQTGEDWRIVFRLYRSPLFVIIFIALVGVNIYGWRAHGVNHVLIFELDPRDHLGCTDLLEIAFTFGGFWCLSVLLFLWSGTIGIPPLVNPLILTAFMLLYLLNPTRTLHYNARMWLLRCVGRVITAPLYPVRFCDFWLADQFNSLVPVFLDIEYTSCFYLSSNDLYDNVDRCVVREPKDLILRSIVACLPAWWRFAQCLRRYFDEGRRANPHLLNACKYSSVWLVVLFSTLTEHTQDNYQQSVDNPFFICWMMSLVFGSCYTYTWDIKMDWGIGDPKAPREYWLLREEIIYPARYYYIAIVEDFVLRFGWTLSVSLTEIGAIPPDLITLVLAPFEIFRRFLWNFLRLENEHLNNCGEFRAVRDISISGQNIDLSALNRILKVMDEPDGLSMFRRKTKQRLLASKKKPMANDSADSSVVLII